MKSGRLPIVVSRSQCGPLTVHCVTQSCYTYGQTLLIGASLEHCHESAHWQLLTSLLEKPDKEDQQVSPYQKPEGHEPATAHITFVWGSIDWPDFCRGSIRSVHWA